MILNVYEKRKIVKTYTTAEYDLMFGTLEDVANAVNLDELKTGTETEIMRLVLGLVTRNLATVKDLMKDIFDGITDEELRKTKVTEMASVIADVVRYTIVQLNIDAPKN